VAIKKHGKHDKGCGLISYVSRRCKIRAMRHRRGGHRKGWTVDAKFRARVARRQRQGGCHGVIVEDQIQASLNPIRGFFAIAKTGMPIPGARSRAWSCQEVRTAGRPAPSRPP